MMSMDSLTGTSSDASQGFAAEEYGNDASIEALWAMKAYDHAQVYFNILCSADPRFLKLTPNDDALYGAFREDFPHFELGQLQIEELKSEISKEKWRTFCNSHKDAVEDYNFGTLVRNNSKLDYTDENSTLVTRIQFCCIEIARNKEGYNDEIRKNFKINEENVA